MTAPVKLNFKIYRGSTFSETLRWESTTRVYVPIANISRTAPMMVTAPNHGVPKGWRTKITNALGMKEVNSPEYVKVTDVTQNTLSYNTINALTYTAYVSSGVLEYNKPVDLTSYTAKMQLREKLTSTEVLMELTTENSGITIDPVNYTISLNISAADTAEFNFKSAVYSLKLINGNTVVPFIQGSISVESDITR